MAGETPSIISHVMLIKVALEPSSRRMLLGTVGVTVVTFSPTLSINRLLYYMTNTLYKMMTAHLVRTVGMFD